MLLHSEIQNRRHFGDIRRHSGFSPQFCFRYFWVNATKKTIKFERFTTMLCGRHIRQSFLTCSFWLRKSASSQRRHISENWLYQHWTHVSHRKNIYSRAGSRRSWSISISLTGLISLERIAFVLWLKTRCLLWCLHLQIFGAKWVAPLLGAVWSFSIFLAGNRGYVAQQWTYDFDLKWPEFTLEFFLWNDSKLTEPSNWSHNRKSGDTCLHRFSPKWEGVGLSYDVGFGIECHSPWPSP